MLSAIILSTLYLVYWVATIDTVDRYGAEVFILPSAEMIAPVSFKIAQWRFGRKRRS